MKILTSYINYTIGQYIIEPKYKFVKWLKNTKKYNENSKKYEIVDLAINMIISKRNLSDKLNKIRNNYHEDLFFDNLYFMVNRLIDIKKIWTNTVIKNFFSYYKTEENIEDAIQNAIQKNFSLRHINALGMKYVVECICLNKDKKVAPIIKEHFEEISWRILSRNSADWAVDILLNNLNKVDYSDLSINSNDRIVDYLLKNQSLIDVVCILLNTNIKVRDYILKNIDNINWKIFSKNRSKWALDILKKNINQPNINVYQLYNNPFSKKVNKNFSNKYYLDFDKYLYNHKI